MTTTTTLVASFDAPALRLMEEHVRRLLVTMGFAAAVVYCRYRPQPTGETTLLIEIEAGDEGKLLIGTQGQHLAALQHVMRTVLRRQLPVAVLVVVDVNGYQARRERSLVQLAEASARRATMQGKVVVLKPMSSAERRLVHSALAGRADVKTESMGEEPHRRVVIKPLFL